MTSLSRSDIREILELVELSAFDEMKLEVGGTRIELRRRGAGAAPVAPPAQPLAVTQGAALGPAPPPPVSPPSTAGRPVPAPLLGTFYRAPKPGADAFVAVGARVTPDSVIGIIEVMKLMNSVTAGVSGIVTALHAEDGDLVEHGQALISVQPD